MPLPNTNYNELSAITLQYYIPKMIDNIFSSNVLLKRLKDGKSAKTYEGGTKIVQPILYAKTTAAGSFRGTQTLDVTSNDQFTAAEFEMKQKYANITISREDELKNSGSKTQILDFVAAKVQIAEKTLSDLLGDGLYSSGTDSDEVVGLRVMVTGTGTTYGGISKTTYSWWRSQVDSTTTTLTIPAMTSLFGDCTVGNDKPTLAITTQDQQDIYHGLLQPQERYIDEKMADAGFVNLAFRGIPIVADNKCPTGYFYFLNEKYISFMTHKEENFRFESFIKPVNQAAASAKIYWAGNLVGSNCRMQGVFTALT